MFSFCFSKERRSIKTHFVSQKKKKKKTNPAKYPGIAAGFGVTAREGGARGLVKGWVPTLLGYSVQGAAKFGLYEYFKK